MTTLPMGGGCCNPCAPVRSVQAACEIVCGGAGAVALEGENFCITGTAPNQVLKIKNVTTGLANRIDTVNADPDVTARFDDGSAC